MIRALTRRAPLSPAADPNVIPFIDVLLVLLIIFMVTAPKPTVDLHVEMAGRRHVEQVVIPATIVDVREGDDGCRVFVAGQAVAIENLADVVLARVLSGDGVLTRDDALAEAPVFVRADMNLAYGSVVTVLDELRHGGFAKAGVFSQTADDA